VITEHPEIAKKLAAIIKAEQKKIPKTKPIGWININLLKKKKKK